MCAYFHDIIDVCLSAFRKYYNTQLLLVKAAEHAEDWRKALDNGKYVGANLMDLSKAFNGLFLVKLHALLYLIIYLFIYLLLDRLGVSYLV